MKLKYWLALFLGIFPVFFLLLDLSEFVRARSDTVHLYPFGSEHVNNYFYESLTHYRLMLGIGVILALSAIAGVVGIWRNRQYAWIAYVPFVAWQTTLIIMANSGD